MSAFGVKRKWVAQQSPLPWSKMPGAPGALEFPDQKDAPVFRRVQPIGRIVPHRPIFQDQFDDRANQKRVGRKQNEWSLKERGNEYWRIQQQVGLGRSCVVKLVPG